MASDFNKTSIAYGMKASDLQHIDKQTKKKLVRLMARLAERSYRRGFQQGYECDRPVADLVKFRFFTSLDRSPWPDNVDEKGKWHKTPDTAIERLLMENGVLQELGLCYHDGDPIEPLKIK